MKNMRCPKPISTFLFLSFTTFIISSLNLSYCNSTLCPQIEKDALLSFKQSLDDPDDGILSSWNSKVDCCQWNGVVCNNLTGHVYELHLRWDDRFPVLRGRINNSLLNLQYLRYLDLSGSWFEGSIPSFFGSFERLEYLNLSMAGFNGSNPRFLGNLSRLRVLSLSMLELEVDSLKWMSGLFRLERLDMSYVDLSKAGNWVQVIKTFPSLVELCLQSCGLNSIDQLDYGNISSLAILDLSLNDFHSFQVPRWIFQLSNLVYLDLRGNYFEGPIPISSNATKLWYLDLSVNKFNSTIPDWIYSCRLLKYVYISSSHLHGSVSNAIVNLTSLNVLDLSINHLNGRIPAEITRLCRLQTLDLVGNYLQGDLSVLFQNMSDCFLGSLQILALGHNQLSGHLPYQLGKFRSLSRLDLGDNSISGSIPFHVGNLSSLHFLALHYNKLDGNLPESIGQLCYLEYVSVQDNMLEGVVTEKHFANLTKLSWLTASGNHLTLRVHQHWIPPFKLHTIELGLWNLGPKIPSWLETQKDSLRYLNLSNTQITGIIPTWVWKIDDLSLSNNQLYGEIPYISGVSMDLNSNNFSGSIPRVANRVRDLDLSDNSFSGGISHFLCDMTYGTYEMVELLLGGNHLTGEIPDCLLKWPSLRVLNLENNNMSGKIPKSIGHLNRLVSLNLYRNRFYGEIPSSMKNCTSLGLIELSHNHFSGNIPAWIGTSLKYVKYLLLRSNEFGGEIPSDLCHLTFLQILDLSANKISGAIPNCIDNFTAMATKRSLFTYDDYEQFLSFSNMTEELITSAYVSTKEGEQRYYTTLSLVTYIDLSSNNLSGNVPQELTSLVELRSLNLSNNKLKGSIPERIGDMKQLEYLDMSRNSLSGEISNSLASLSFLSFLNLSYNNLSGMIPQSTQILGMGPSSFIGNKLCGPPLTKSCNNNDSPSQTTRIDEVKDGDKEFDKWFYIFLSSGYIVGLFSFCALLIINRELGESYFKLLEEVWNKACVFISPKIRR